MLSNAEILTHALSCYTADGAYHKLKALRLQREEALEELLAYNKREQSESVTACQILADNDTLAHKLLAEYHIAELKTRVKFNKPRVAGLRRELTFIDRVLTALDPWCVYTKQTPEDAEQSALYDEHVLSIVWAAYIASHTTGNRLEALRLLRPLPFNLTPVLDCFDKQYASPEQLFFVLGISAHITLLNRVTLPTACSSRLLIQGTDRHE